VKREKYTEIHPFSGPSRSLHHKKESFETDSWKLDDFFPVHDLSIFIRVYRKRGVFANRNGHAKMIKYDFF
jgi:hypothetical protein